MMGETASKEKEYKKSFFKGLATEFKKIVWPDKETVVKQTAAVITASVVLGLVIALIDLIIKFGLKFIL